MNGRITLTGLRARGYHGVYDFERAAGQDFVVDVRLELDLGKAAVSDDVADTVHYGELAERLVECGVRILSHKVLDSVAAGGAQLKCVFTGREESFAAEAVVLVTARLPETTLATSLAERHVDWDDAGIASVTTIGDALAPGTIAAAVFSGRRCAEEMDAPPLRDALPFRREVTALVEGWAP